MTEILIGILLVINGTVFNMVASNESDAYRNATNTVNVHKEAYELADRTANYYEGQAMWESQRVGHTIYEQMWTSEATRYHQQAAYEGGQWTRLESERQDARRQEALYNGISIASFAVGAGFVVHGIWGFRSIKMESDGRQASVKIEKRF